MRIDLTGESRHRQREHIFAVGLRQTANRKLVATRQRFTNFRIGFAGQLQAEFVKFNLAVPQRVKLCFALRPWRFAPVEVKGVGTGEIHWTCQYA